MTGKSCSTFYPRMQCMAKVSEMYVRHHGTALTLLSVGKGNYVLNLLKNILYEFT